MSNPNNNARPPIRFLIVDDHEITRVGFMALARLEPDWTVCGESGDAGKALELARRLRPDFAVVDLRLNGGDGLELVRNLRQELPDIHILVYSGSDEAIFAQRCIHAGAQGFVMKLEPVATPSGGNPSHPRWRHPSQRGIST